MSIEQIIFYIFGSFLVLSAFSILITKNIFYSAFLLLLSFLGIAGIYVFAGADFLAITQVVIYIGGILILIMFGIMFTTRGISKNVLTGSKNIFAGGIIGMLMCGLLIKGINEVGFSDLPWISKAETITYSSIPTIGINMMTDYVIVFELAAILLLVALIGATYIAAKNHK